MSDHNHNNHNHSHSHDHASHGHSHSHDHSDDHFSAAAEKKLAENGGNFGRLGELFIRLCSIQQTHEPKTFPRAVMEFVNLDSSDNDDNPCEFIKDLTPILYERYCPYHALFEYTLRDHAKTFSIPEVKEQMKKGSKHAANQLNSDCRIMVFAAPGQSSSNAAYLLACCLLDQMLPCAENSAIPEEVIQHTTELLDKHRKSPLTPIAILSHCSDESLIAMVGTMLQAGTHGCVLLLDGLATAVAASIAVAIDPAVASSLIAGHITKEPGHREILHKLGLTPILDLQVERGDSIGALLALPILDFAAELY